MTDKAEKKSIGSGRKLASPLDLAWPKLSDDIDKQIVGRLKDVFSRLTCLRQVKKPFSWRKRKKSSQNEKSEVSTEDSSSRQSEANCKMVTEDSSSAAEVRDQLSAEHVEKRKKIKSLLYVGAKNVIRALERDALRLVLVWRSCQPAELKKAVLMCAAGTECPGACVSDLLSSVRVTWNQLSSLTALGFKKTEEPNVFDDFVKFVQDVSPKISIPELPTNCISPGAHGSSLSSTVSANNQTDVSKETSQKEIKEFPLNYKQYYIYRNSLTNEKTFGQQDFIKFDADKPETTVNVIDGRPVYPEEDDTGSDKRKFYSISSRLRCISEQRDSDVCSRKRKLNCDESTKIIPSAYRSINVKLPNLASMKSKKKQKRKKKGKNILK